LAHAGNTKKKNTEATHQHHRHRGSKVLGEYSAFIEKYVDA